jgi:hypothetical protein
MQYYKINVTEIEELQTISDIKALDEIFTKAKRTIVGGAPVLMGRKDANKKWDQFDELTTEEDLEQYKKGVFKYL